MKNSVYICGDSFCASDLDYVDIKPWHEQIDNTTNLSRVCASNLLISLQVERAINDKATAIIVEFTSVTRGEVKFRERTHEDLYDRFYNLIDPDKNTNLSSYTVLAVEDAFALTNEQQELLKKYNKEFFDLDLAIHRDKLIIEATLQKLVDSNIPFKFDQGGFEHPGYGGVGTYFTKYKDYRSKYCLWDYANTRDLRPYFHIQDQKVHDMIADYYNNFIQA